jgi:hypothetical protein
MSLPENKSGDTYVHMCLPENKSGVELVRDVEADLISGDGHRHQDVNLVRARSPQLKSVL